FNESGVHTCALPTCLAMERRKVILNSGLAVGVAPTFPSIPVFVRQSQKLTETSEGYNSWRDVREQFLLTDDQIHMALMLFASHLCQCGKPSNTTGKVLTKILPSTGKRISCNRFWMVKWKNSNSSCNPIQRLNTWNAIPGKWHLRTALRWVWPYCIRV